MPVNYYTGIFLNAEDKLIRVDIVDMESGDFYDPFEPQVYTDITLDYPGFTDETENNYDPFAPIKATRGFINVKTDNVVGLDLFSSGGANRFFVTVNSSMSGIVLKGYLVLDDNTEPYLTKGHTMQLVVNDGLGSLKGRDLKDFDGDIPVDENSLLYFVVWCLKETGLRLNINIAVNLFEENHDDRTASDTNCPFAQTYLKAQTFEKDIREMEDCYTVLEKILFSWGARIVQHRGDWWIVRMAEYNLDDISYTTYTWEGDVVSGTLNENIDKKVGHDSNVLADAYFISDGNNVKAKRPVKSIEHVFNYEFPKELPKNINYERGALKVLTNPGICRAIKDTITGDYVSSWDGLTTFTWATVEFVLCFISDIERNNALTQLGDPVRYVAENITASVSLYAYQFDDWDLTIGINGSGSAVVDGSIIREYTDGYESQKYVEITAYTASEIVHFMSDDIHLCEKEKLQWSFDWRLSSNVSGSGSITDTLCFIRLWGDDGTYWTLDETGEWKQSNSTWSVNFATIQTTYDNAFVDQSEWQSVSVASRGLPVSGNIRISLMASSLFHTGRATHFSNLQFSIKKYINGGFKDYTGESYKVEQTGEYLKKDPTVSYLADGPCFEYKGAMLYPIWNMSHTAIIGYGLTRKWDDWALNNWGILDGETSVGLDRFMKWQAYNRWNWDRVQRYAITAQFRGLNSNTSNHIGLLNRIIVLGNTEPTNQRYYVITSLRRNWHSCDFEANLVEIGRVDERGNFRDTFTFKYKIQ